MTTPEPALTPQRKRGGCLTAFLVIMLIANPLTAISYLLNGEAFSRSLPDMPGWAIPALGVIALANFVCAIGLWQWKKWGMYGFAGLSLITVFVNAVSIGIGLALFGLLGVVILGFLVRPVWNQME